MSVAFLKASLEGRWLDAQRELGAALPAGWPDDRAARRLAFRLGQMRDHPEAAPWLLRAIVDSASNAVAGYINFHGPPIDGRAELGYTVFESQRRRGYAEEAARGMMRWAHRAHGIGLFVVSISPTNLPSLGMAAKLGFKQTGSQWDDEDGEELVFELHWQDG